jgi:hypothetical protein
MGMGGQCHAPAALSPGKMAGTNFTGSQVGARVGLEACGKEEGSCSHRGLKPEPLIHNELLQRLGYPGPKSKYYLCTNQLKEIMFIYRSFYFTPLLTL